MSVWCVDDEWSVATDAYQVVSANVASMLWGREGLRVRVRLTHRGDDQTRDRLPAVLKYYADALSALCKGDPFPELPHFVRGEYRGVHYGSPYTIETWPTPWPGQYAHEDLLPFRGDDDPRRRSLLVQPRE